MQLRTYMHGKTQGVPNKISKIFSWENTNLSQEETTTIGREVRCIFKNSLPLCVALLSHVASQMVSFSVCNRLGSAEQAAVVLASMWIECVEFMVRPFAAQMSMLVCAAYGAGNKSLVGIWLGMFLVLSTACICLSSWVRLMGERGLRAMGVNAVVASHAQRLILYMWPFQLIELWSEVLMEWHVSRLLILPTCAIEIITCIARPILYMMFISKMKLGLFGVAVSEVSINCFKLGSVVFVTWGSGAYKEYLHGLHCQDMCASSRWKTILRTVGPAYLGSIVQNAPIKFMGLGFASGGVQETMVYRTMELLSCVPLLMICCVAGVIGIRVGHFLGKNNPDAARLACLVGLGFTFVLSLTVGVVLALTIKSVARFVANDPVVVAQVVELRWPLFGWCLSMVFLPCLEILVKQGRAWIIAVCVPTCVALVGVPSLLAAGEFMRGAGIMWVSIYMTFSAVAICLSLCVLWSNWKHQAKVSVNLSEKHATQKQGNSHSQAQAMDSEVQASCVKGEDVSPSASCVNGEHVSSLADAIAAAVIVRMCKDVDETITLHDNTQSLPVPVQEAISV